MATMRVFLVFVTLFTTSIFGEVNAPPKRSAEPKTNEPSKRIAPPKVNPITKEILEEKIEKLKLLDRTISGTVVLKNDAIKSFLDTVNPDMMDDFRRLKSIILGHLKSNICLDTSTKSPLFQALQLLDISSENGLLFSKIKNQPEAEKMVNLKNVISSIIKDHLKRMSMLTRILPGKVISGLNELLCCIHQISDKDAIIIAQGVKSTIDSCNGEYQKFIAPLKGSIRNFINTKCLDKFPESKTALDQYLIITRAFFVHTMDYKQKLERKDYEAKFGLEFKDNLIHLAKLQVRKIQIDTKKEIGNYNSLL